MSYRTMMTCDQCGKDFDRDDRAHDVQVMIYTRDKYNGTKHYCSAACLGRAVPEIAKEMGEELPAIASSADEGDQMKARTPKNRMVRVEECGCGTHWRAGQLFYGCVRVAVYCGTGTGRAHTLGEALVLADEMIDRCGLVDVA